MTKQFELFSGKELKEHGCAAVAENNEEYLDWFKSAAQDVLRAKGEVTSEEVVAKIGMPDGHPNAVGAAMRSFASEHHLKVSGYRKSQRPSCHAAIIAIWKP